LEEANYTIDFVGGTSIGSIIGGFIAMGYNSEKIIEVSRHMFLKNPTPYSELNIFPVYSLLSGKRLDRMIKDCFESVTIEDLPINYFCISSNLTESNFEVHNTGALAKAIRASISLPGILTPVIKNKNILVDGGIFNNLPIDVMAKQNVGTIIAISLRTEIEPLALDTLPSKSKFLFNQLFKRKNMFAQLPTLLNTFMKTLTSNSDKTQKHMLSGADIVFQPDVSGYGLVAWKNYDEIVEVGYRHAKEVLEQMNKTQD
jgi:predicted acylesterase/phospholipase RssA